MPGCVFYLGILSAFEQVAMIGIVGAAPYIVWPSQLVSAVLYCSSCSLLVLRTKVVQVVVGFCGGYPHLRARAHPRC